MTAMRYWPPPVYYDDKDLPPLEHRQLPPLPTVPTFPHGVETVRSEKRKIDFRGPETVHNTLAYRQYGLMAVSGGTIRPGHIDMMRAIVNRHLDTNRMFAVWRIDPPWKSVTSKGRGKKRGGGKGKIVDWETPVRAGRVIFEIAGRGGFDEVEYFLREIASISPFLSLPVSQERLDNLRWERDELARINVNPLTMKRLIKHNFGGVHQNCLAHDLLWAFEYE